ncbi:ATP synthase F1 subunit epsilon [Nannocystis sp. SCPEA4]|uniref:ATP synthase F1 subunit epsilon n=1 Tax=Nannocystis sp. SCPEA4 TaxID=2996787 RepID=UPI00226EE970|nr:ATP synthase F1 subunit epsilon [Nannocystis sp. SCPEA4]MCY1062278.1 ATP synthase F1 subunit epsilon [Nannocystis sp. SCPEA4]
MADTTIKLDILTPLGPKRHGVVVPGVEVPGLLGELGVLPEHVPFITPVVPGVVRFRDGGESVRIAVGAGFLEVTRDNRVVILVERALEVSEIDANKARDELKRVQADLSHDLGSIDAAEHRKLVTEQGWLEAQLRATQP